MAIREERFSGPRSSRRPKATLPSQRLLACLQTLTVDAALAPDGALLVATHSGGPDWGSGPDGDGTLFKIRYAEPSAPQPTLAWAESPREVPSPSTGPSIPSSSGA